MSASNEPHPRPPLPAWAPASSLGLLAAAVAGLALSALCDLFSLFAGFRLRAVVDGDGGFGTAAQRELEAAATMYDTAGRYQVIVYVPVAVIFVVWFFLMRRNTGLLAPDQFRNGPGWAIGAWLIPLANLWMPYRVAVDMWGAATLPPAEGERYRARTWPVNLWWGLFVLSVLYSRYAGTQYKNAGTWPEIKDAVTQYMAADLAHIAAAAAAVYFAVRLTGMQRRKAAVGPFGPAAVKGTPDRS
ncbi:MAG: DUF4328 domain-containing protein [Streptomyces sp.]|nr:DUF4328 domain-containing protein [Streptomyces sp.]NUT28446.1 DUF4328 domain-containing protein [Streptomyces sp.]